jgi:glycosyltransferase involved in cell wall biosynthesis
MTPELTVLHIGAGRYRPGDRSHVTYGIWRELASGFRDYYVIGRSVGPPAEWSDGNLHVILIGSRVDREAEFLLSQFKAVPLARRIRPQVIVCQSPVLGGLAAIAIARRTGARVLMELHGAEFFAPAHFGSRLWFLQALTRFALRRADRIRVQTARMADQVARTYGTALGSRVRILPPRVDLSRFRMKETAKPHGKALRVAMIGAVNLNKGQLRLAEALRDAPFEIELHVVGAGPSLDELVAKSGRLRREGSRLQVVAHGPLAHDRVAEMLSDCDVFVMYSRTEATPRAMMEAMAVGLPVVTTNAGFCADIVEHGREGFVLGSDPDGEIVEMLDRFRTDPQLAKRMGAAGQKRARRDYDSVRLFDEYRKLIAETAGR